MNLRIPLAIVAAALGVALLAPGPAAAGGSFTWTGEGDGRNWTNECNWWPKNQCKQSYPSMGASDDDAVIAYQPGKTPPHVVLGDNLSLGSVTLSGPGSLTGGSIDVSKSFSWSGGTLATPVEMGAFAAGVIDGKVDKTLSATITNSGRLNIGPALVRVGRGVGIDNRARGTVTAALGARWEGLECCVKPPRINNAGKFVVSAPLVSLGGNAVTLSGVSYNGGSVDIQKGRLQLEIAPSSISVGSWVDGGGKVVVGSRSILTVKGPFTIDKGSTIELATGGVINGSGKMMGGGRLLWTGGRMDAALTTDGIEAVLDGPDSKQLGGVIVNESSFNVLFPSSKKEKTGPLQFGSRAKFVNNGSFVAREGFRIEGMICCATPARFENNGVFTAALNPNGSRGAVEVANIRYVAGGETHLEKAKLEFPVGQVAMAGGKVTGSGTFRIDEATDATINNRFEVEPKVGLELRGDLDGTGTLSGGGPLYWLAGRMSADLKVASTDPLIITGKGWKQLDGRLTTLGRVSLRSPKGASTQLRIGAGGKFVSAGPFTTGGKVELFGPICCNNPGRFVNEGTFTIPGGAELSSNFIFFQNTETVDLKGVIRIGGGYYIQTEGRTQLSGGQIVSKEIVDIRGGYVYGSGTIDGVVRNAGTFAPGAPGVPGSIGLIRIEGAYSQYPTGTLAIDVRGTRPGAGHDQLQVTREAWLAGRLAIASGAGFSPPRRTKVTVLAVPKRNDRFNRVGDPGLPNGTWQVDYSPGDVSLVAQ